MKRWKVQFSKCFSDNNFVIHLPCTIVANDGWIRQWWLACVRLPRPNYANVIYANCNYTACTVSPTARCSVHDARCSPLFAVPRVTDHRVPRQLYANLLNSNLTGSHLPPLVPADGVYLIPSAPCASSTPAVRATSTLPRIELYRRLETLNPRYIQVVQRKFSETRSSNVVDDVSRLYKSCTIF